MKILHIVPLLLLGSFLAYGENVSCFQIGGNYTHAHIAILGQPSFHGNLGGIQGSYEYRPWNSFYGALRVVWKEGSTKNSSATRDLTYVDVQERFGYSYAISSRAWMLSLFSGFGYRHIGHEFKQRGASSIQFDYNEFYVPVGFLSDYTFYDRYSVGLNFVWMPQVYSTVKIAPLKGARWIIRNSLSNILAEVPFTFFLTKNKRYSLIVKPFYEYWEDGHTIAKTATGIALGVPGNTYNFWGAELNFGFSF